MATEAAMSYNEYKERAGVLLAKAKLSAEDTNELLMACSVPLEELPAEVVEANPFIKWRLAQPELKDCLAAVIDYRRMCELLEAWLAESKARGKGAAHG